MTRIIAYQGEAGAYSEEGVLATFPESDHLPLATIRKVFESVEVGRADYGLVPIDNSQAGSINETYDLFLKHGLHLVAETIVRVNHCLLGLPGTAIDDLAEVISHPQAIAQCEEFLTSLSVWSEPVRSHRVARPTSTGSRSWPNGYRPIPTTTHASGRYRATRVP
jgi:prephenate dehydratase